MPKQPKTSIVPIDKFKQIHHLNHKIEEVGAEEQIDGPEVFLTFLIQFTYIGLYFWLSAMAFHVMKSLPNYFQEQKSLNPRKKLLFFTLYAQGSSVILSIILMSVQKKRHHFSILFLNSHVSKEEGPLQYQPLHIIIVILFILIFVFLFIIGVYLFCHRRQTRGMAQG